MKDQTVSVRFQDLRLDQGLQAVLKTLDAFYFYGAQGEAPATLKAVWLYPKGKGSRIVPAPPETYASTAEMQQDLSDPDPAERARAAEALIKRQGRRALDTILQVMVDPDEKVRYRAMNQAVRSGLALPEYLTEQLALNDSSPVVRFLALEAMTNVRGADPARIRQIAEQALNDPNEVVRQQAQDILAELGATGQPAEPSESQQPQGTQ
jgi:HEAT repeat protein